MTPPSSEQTQGDTVKGKENEASPETQTSQSNQARSQPRNADKASVLNEKGKAPESSQRSRQDDSRESPCKSEKRESVTKKANHTSRKKRLAKLSKELHTIMESIEEPTKKVGKLVLWASPLILAGLEVSHEIRNHAHKRKIMDQELEKGRLELQVRSGKQEKNMDGKASKGDEAEGSQKQPSPQRRRSASHRSATQLRRAASSLRSLERLLAREGSDPQSLLGVRRQFRRRSPRRKVRFLSRSGSPSNPSYESYYWRTVAKWS